MGWSPQLQIVLVTQVGESNDFQCIALGETYNRTTITNSRFWPLFAAVNLTRDDVDINSRH